MKKAICLQVTLWVEGNDEPAHDFSASSMQGVRDILAAGANKHPELTLSIRDIQEDTSEE